VSLTIDSKLGELLENPGTKAILERHLPDAVMKSDKLTTTGAGLTIGQVAPASEGMIATEMVQAIAADLEALGA